MEFFTNKKNRDGWYSTKPNNLKKNVFFSYCTKKMPSKRKTNKELSKEDVERLFREYVRTKATILKKEQHTGSKSLVERRVANSLLSYARQAQATVKQ